MVARQVLVALLVREHLEVVAEPHVIAIVHLGAWSM